MSAIQRYSTSCLLAEEAELLDLMAQLGWWRDISPEAARTDWILANQYDTARSRWHNCHERLLEVRNELNRRLAA